MNLARRAPNEIISSRNSSVGVVIPTFNAAEFLPQAIDSVLKQTVAVDDIVVVDDGSTDQTQNVIKRFIENGIRYIRQNNQGSAGARNTGVESLSTDYVCFLDTDDSWLPDKTAVQRRILDREPRVGLVSGNQIFWDPDRSIKKLRTFSQTRPKEIFNKRLALSNVVGNPSMVMIRRSVLEDIGLFNPALRFGDDWDMWIRIAARTEIAFADEAVAIYRWHHNNQSRQNQKACLRAYREISRRAIEETHSSFSKAFAFPFLLRHTPLYICYRSLRFHMWEWIRHMFSSIFRTKHRNNTK